MFHSIAFFSFSNQCWGWKTMPSLSVFTQKSRPSFAVGMKGHIPALRVTSVVRYLNLEWPLFTQSPGLFARSGSLFLMLKSIECIEQKKEHARRQCAYDKDFLHRLIVFLCCHKVVIYRSVIELVLTLSLIHLCGNCNSSIWRSERSLYFHSYL